MRMVVDANYFQNPGLEEFLRADSRNRVVFTDMACMETYKGDPVSNICKSLDLVGHYPMQVEILKSTREIVRLQNSLPVPVGEWLDSVSTAEFPQFCLQLRRAAAGDRAVLAALEENGRAAQAHFEAMLADVGDMLTSTKRVIEVLGAKNVQAIRSSRAPVPSDYAKTTFQLIFELAGALFSGHPEVEHVPRDGDALRETLIFRYALAGHVLRERLISDGGGNGVRLDRLRNDVIDMTYVAYATFFDGLLTRETKMMEIYDQVRWLLDEVFTSNGEGPLSSWAARCCQSQ